MNLIPLEVALAAAMLGCALCVWYWTDNDNPTSWDKVVSKFKQNHHHLRTLFFDCPFSAGLEQSPLDLWSRMGGFDGLLTIFINIGVFLSALDILDILNIQHSRSTVDKEKIDLLRQGGRALRFKVLISLIRSLITRHSCHTEELTEVVISYSRLTASFSLTIIDHFPSLLSSYLTHVSEI